jgi:hypothetical protein
MEIRVISIKLKECGFSCPYYKPYETDSQLNIGGQYCNKKEKFMSTSDFYKYKSNGNPISDVKLKFPKWCPLKKEL